MRKSVLVTAVILALVGCQESTFERDMRRLSEPDDFAERYLANVEAQRAREARGCGIACMQNLQGKISNAERPSGITVYETTTTTTLGAPSMYDRITDPYFSGSGVE